MIYREVSIKKEVVYGLLMVWCTSVVLTCYSGKVYIIKILIEAKTNGVWQTWPGWRAGKWQMQQIKNAVVIYYCAEKNI